MQFQISALWRLAFRWVRGQQPDAFKVNQVSGKY